MVEAPPIRDLELSDQIREVLADGLVVQAEVVRELGHAHRSPDTGWRGVRLVTDHGGVERSG